MIDKLRESSWLIGWPTYDGTVPVDAAVSLARATSILAPNGVKTGCTYSKYCSLVDKARNQMTHEFMNSHFQKMITLDSDIIFHEYDLIRLMILSLKYPIIAAGYPAKNLHQAGFFCWPDSNPPKVDDGQIMRVKGVGAGFMCIDRSVFEALKPHVGTFRLGPLDEDKTDEPVASTYWQITYPEGTRHMGEDLSFINLAKEHGFETYVDLGINLKHVGLAEYDYKISELAAYQGWISNA